MASHPAEGLGRFARAMASVLRRRWRWTSRQRRRQRSARAPLKIDLCIDSRGAMFGWADSQSTEPLACSVRWSRRRRLCCSGGQWLLWLWPWEAVAVVVVAVAVVAVAVAQV